MLSGLSELECVSVGLHSAMESLESSQTVPNSLKFELLKSSLPFVELPLTGERACNYYRITKYSKGIRTKNFFMSVAEGFIQYECTH